MRSNTISPELLDQPPPSDAALELSELGGLIVDLQRMGAVREIVTSEDFHVGPYGTLFGLLLAAFDRGRQWVDVRRLVDHLRKTGLLREIGAGRLAEMAFEAATADETIATAETIRDLAQRREAIHRGCEMIRAAYVGDVSASMEGALV